MTRTNLVILEQDHARFLTILERVRVEANAKLVFLLDKNGQQIACSGDDSDVDLTALASLAAGNVAATEGLAQLVGEREFSNLFHEGERESLHVSLVAGKFVLVVIFDARSSLGLVRLRVQQSTSQLAQAVRDVVSREPRSRMEALASPPLGDLTDEDIDKLFG